MFTTVFFSMPEGKMKSDCPLQFNGPNIPRTVLAAPEECVFDSQGGFTCPGSKAYLNAWAAQERAESSRNKWNANWVHHGDTPELTYEMQWSKPTKKCNGSSSKKR